MLHSKRVEMTLNMKVFPAGYFQNLTKPIKQVKFVGEIRKGIFNGPSTIFVNGKKVC
jgi:hypothetical protein